MDIHTIIATYQQTIQQGREKLSKVKNKIYRIGSLKLLLFVACIAGIIYFVSAGWTTILGVIAITLIPFLVLVKYHNRLFNEKDYLEKEIEVNEQELSAINYDYSCFDGGKEYIDSAHLYTFDLDIFGDKSLFQYLNRTCTAFGKQKLSEWFMAPSNNKKEIEQRQKAVQELTLELNFRQHFRILGLLYKGNANDGKEIIQWTKERNYFSEKKLYRFAIYFVPLTNLILFILGIAGIISFNWFGLAFVAFVILNFSLQKSITLFQISYDKKLSVLSTYAKLMEIAEQKEWKADELKQIKSQLSSASNAVKQLSEMMNSLNQRNNIIISTILNGLLFWELRKVINIEKWKNQYARQLPEWLKAIGEMDALCSLATFAYNHPEYTYPTIATTPFTLEATEMGHPLMEREKCVRNSIHITKKPFFVIITGANMAGKSTYLRTIGVNYLLACIGAPVCCDKMDIYPAHLITSLRTSDSLTDNESYFFAELKRLKLIIDKLNAQEELFIILDEILKGTNSMDKQKGSLALIKQFMSLQANGIIATHDLLLGSLAEIYPNNIKNFRFEADITNNELTFSYRLKEGVAQNMNACFLMKKMGIVVNDD